VLGTVNGIGDLASSVIVGLLDYICSLLRIFVCSNSSLAGEIVLAVIKIRR
jgi:hypothetical protein